VGQDRIHGPCEIRRGRSRADDALRMDRGARAQSIDRLIAERVERHDEAHGSGNTDGRRTAHGQRRDGGAHVVEGAQVALDELLWQRGLIDDADGIAVRRPAHGLDRLHGRKRTHGMAGAEHGLLRAAARTRITFRLAHPVRPTPSISHPSARRPCPSRISPSTSTIASRPFASIAPTSSMRSTTRPSPSWMRRWRSWSAATTWRACSSPALAPRRSWPARTGQAAFSRIESCPKPVIAAVNGFALGGGCELAMACHIRIAADTAKFGQPELKLGITPGYGGTQRLARLVGKGRALQLLLTCEMIDAAEAYRIGLVNKVVPAAELLGEAERMLRQIIAFGPLAVALCIEAVNRGDDLPLDAGLELEASYFGLLSATADMHEGMQAFLEKRAARFSGR